MKGIIDNVWENESKNGKKYVTVEIAGEKYSVWDTGYFDHLKQGAEISYDVRQKGSFKNLIDITPAGDATEEPVYRGRKDRQIARLSCLRSASEILAPIHMDTDAKRDLVIDTARYFERYITGDEVGTLGRSGEDNSDEKGEK